MRLPALARTTPFRLTLVFLALFAAAAAAFLAYIYVATAGEVTRRADREIGREIDSLEAVYARGALPALNRELIQRSVGDRPFLYLLMDAHARPVTGNLAQSPVEPAGRAPAEAGFRITDTDPDGAILRTQGWGRQIRLPTGELLFVGTDIGEGRASVIRIVRAIWGAGVLVIVFGLAGGLFVSRNVTRSLGRVNRAVAAVEGGDIHARIPLRGVHDEYDELAVRLNAMLDRLERSMGGLRHAGDAIAHDLRSPLTRLRARLEVALMEVEAGHADPRAALVQALEDSDAVLRTFSAVLAIARLEAAGNIADPKPFDVSELAAGVAELYEVLCEEKHQSFGAELARGPRRARRPRLPGPGPGQPAGQRGEIHAGGRGGDAAHPPARLGRDRGHRHRYRPRRARGRPGPGAGPVRAPGAEPQRPGRRPWPVPGRRRRRRPRRSAGAGRRSRRGGRPGAGG